MMMATKGKIKMGPMIRTGTMEALLNGGYSEHGIEKRSWYCLGCGRQWSRKHQAEDCEGRGHVDSYVDTYYSGGIVLNGRFLGRTTTYTRECIGRLQEVKA